jgi:hypothetical protein
MSTDNLTRLVLQVNAGEDATPEELDRLVRQLLGELQDLNEVEEVDLVKSETAPTGAKSIDPVTLGALAIAVLPSFLPKLVDFAQAWAMRGQNRAMKFKGKVGGQEIEFEGSAEELKALLATLAPAKENKRPETPQ